MDNLYHILVGFGPETICGLREYKRGCYADPKDSMQSLWDPLPSDCKDCWGRFTLMQLAETELEDTPEPAWNTVEEYKQLASYEKTK